MRFLICKGPFPVNFRHNSIMSLRGWSWKKGEEGGRLKENAGEGNQKQ